MTLNQREIIRIMFALMISPVFCQNVRLYVPCEHFEVTRNVQTAMLAKYRGDQRKHNADDLSLI